MRKILCTTAILLVLVNSVNASKQLQDYFSIINEAELLICTDKPESALKHYDLAFGMIKEPFGKDVYNAWITAYRINDTTRFSTYSKNLIRHGAFLNPSVHLVLFNQVPGGPPVKDFSEIWLRLKKEIPKEINTDFRNILDSSVTRDREVREHFVKVCGDNYNKCGRDSLNRFDSFNIAVLKSSFDKYGFPSEKNIGYDFDFPGNPIIYSIILGHDRSWGNRQTLDKYFYDHIFTGEFHPQSYALIKDKSYTSFKDSVSSYQKNPDSRFASYIMSVINDTLYVERLPEKMMQQINATRKSIFLESITEMAIKAKFQYRHEYYRLLVGNYLPHWDGLDQTSIDETARISYRPEEIDLFKSSIDGPCKYGLKH